MAAHPDLTYKIIRPIIKKGIPIKYTNNSRAGAPGGGVTAGLIEIRREFASQTLAKMKTSKYIVAQTYSIILSGPTLRLAIDFILRILTQNNKKGNKISSKA